MHSKLIWIGKVSLVFLIVTLLILTPLTGKPIASVKPLNQTMRAQAQLAGVDLNQMMLNAWKDWDALITRWISVNGSLYDPYDFARASSGGGSGDNSTLSGLGFYAMALANMYEQTGDSYYLFKLSAIVEGLMSSPAVPVAGVGYIFYVPTYYYEGSEQDTNPALTMLTAFSAVKLWEWTQNPKFKQLADRVASESLALVTVNNSTDLAWSQGYYQSKDNVFAAKQAIARQAPITLFYTAYGKAINPTYLSYVNRTLHWQLRAQLPSGGFANSIGDTVEHHTNTGIEIFFLTWGSRIASTPFAGYLGSISKALQWLQSLAIDSSYMENYAVTAAVLSAWKSNLTVNIDKAKTAAYIGVRSLNFTTYGVFPDVTSPAFGWRWPEGPISCFLSTYRLPDGTVQPSQLIDYSSYSDTDKDIRYGWATGMGFDRFRFNSLYGSGVYKVTPLSPTLYFFFGFDEPAVSTVQNETYYLNLRSNYPTSTVSQQIYANGLSTVQITGTTTLSIFQEFQDSLYVSLTNGTELSVNNLANSTVTLDTEIMIHQQANPTNYFFIIAPSSTWTATSQAGLLQLKTTITDGRLMLARLNVPGVSASDAFRLFGYFASYLNLSVPIGFTELFDAHIRIKDDVGELKFGGVPGWEPVYENATRQEAKLVALKLPEVITVSQWNFINQSLTANISGVVGVDSTLKIYSGFRFSPLKVFLNGTEQVWGTEWTFDAFTRIFTVNATFYAPSVKLDVFFLEDKTPPNIFGVSRSILTPEYNDTVMVSANIVDDIAGSGVGTTLVGYWNGVQWFNATMMFNSSSNLYEGYIPPLPYATDVQYRIHAADRAGNWNSSEAFSYRVIDTYAPGLSISVQHLFSGGVRVLRPAQGDYVSGNATIRVYCQEENLQNMSLYIDDSFVKLWSRNGTQSYIWNTSRFADGSSHTLKVTAGDLAGNTAESVANVITDNTAPVIASPEWSPKNPSPGESVTVSVSVSDATSGLESVTIWYKSTANPIHTNQSMTLDGGVWKSVLPGQADGVDVEFFIEAYDKAGNQARTTTFNRYHVGYSSLPILLIAALATILIGGSASVAGFVFYRRRQKNRNVKSTEAQRSPPKHDSEETSDAAKADH